MIAKSGKTLVSAEGRVENQKLNQLAALLFFEIVDHSGGSSLYSLLCNMTKLSFKNSTRDPTYIMGAFGSVLY